MKCMIKEYLINIQILLFNGQQALKLIKLQEIVFYVNKEDIMRGSVDDIEKIHLEI